MNNDVKVFDYKDIRYTLSIFVIWSVVCKCQELLGVLTEANPTLTDNCLCSWEDMKLIRFTFPRIEGSELKLPEYKIRMIMNEYLDYEYLPNIDQLPRFRWTDDNYSNMNCLYVYQIGIKEHMVIIDVLFINNDKAYFTARRRENELVKYII